VALDYRSIRALSQRWIGFSEDDVKTAQDGVPRALRPSKARRQRRIYSHNALRTTRSTCDQASSLSRVPPLTACENSRLVSRVAALTFQIALQATAEAVELVAAAALASLAMPQ
jgi:hypothetical protein